MTQTKLFEQFNKLLVYSIANMDEVKKKVQQIDLKIDKATEIRRERGDERDEER
jgi:hypothetical protein